MKANRSPAAPIWTAAVLLVGLFLAAGLPAAGQTFTFSFGKRAPKDSSRALAQALAQQVKGVRTRFDTNRRALRAVPGRGEPAYSRQEVSALVARTGKDLDQAIEKIGEPGLGALRAWSAGEIRCVQEEIATSSVHTAAAFPGLATPRAVAVVASLGWLPLPGPLSLAATAPRQETIPAEKSGQLLDQVGEVVGRIFFLAAHDDLEVKLWVGSTPAPRATFRFWSQGQVTGSTPAPAIIRTNDKRDHVLRGLYAYSAAWAKGPVTELVEYPSPAGPPAARLASERLDLVNGSRFFCCRFDEQYCHHVADEKECRP